MENIGQISSQFSLGVSYPLGVSILPYNEKKKTQEFHQEFSRMGIFPLELSSVTNAANNALISIKFLSSSFPEFFKVIATHSMEYASQIFFHYYI